MRWIPVLFWSLFLVWLAPPSGLAQALPLPSPTMPWPTQVQGFGKTLESARKDALQEVGRILGEFVLRLDPPLSHWQPTETFVVEHLTRGIGSEGPDVEIPGLGTARTWIVQLKEPDLWNLVRLNEQTRLEAVKKLRTETSRGRMRLFAQILAGGLLALSGLVIGSRFRRG